MSSVQVLEGQAISLEIPFDIDEVRWESLSDNKKHYFNKISKALLKINPKIKISSQFDNFNDTVHFNFRTKNKIYYYLKESLETYGQVKEKYFSMDKSRDLIIKL